MTNPIEVLAGVDKLLILLYLGVLLGLGIWGRKEVAAKQFLLGSRRLTLVPFAATLVATWYGGILGVGEFTYLNGIVTFFVFGLPYYLFAAVYAILIAPRIRAGSALSIPERLRQRYGSRTARFGVVTVFLLATPAPYLLMLGVLIQLFTGMALLPALVLGTVFSTLYLWWSGFRSVVRTDVLQFVLMFSGFVALLLVLTSQQPVWEMWGELPAGHRSWRGAGQLSWQELLVWFFIAAWTFVDPGFYQRCAAAESGSTATKGILISLVIWFAFDLLTITTGLYAVGQLPQLAQGGSAMMSFPLLGASLLPVGLKGLFIVALLAVIMSTVDSFTFISASTLGYDLHADKPAPEVLRKRIRQGLVISAAVGLFLAWLVPSVVQLWYTIGMIVVPGLIVVVTSSFHPATRLTDTQALAIGVCGSGTALLWFLWPLMGAGHEYPLHLQPMIPGLFTALTLFVLLQRHVRAR